MDIVLLLMLLVAGILGALPAHSRAERKLYNELRAAGRKSSFRFPSTREKVHV